MNKWFIGAVVFVLSYLSFMVSQIPMQWVVNRATLPENITLHHVKGTIWQGHINKVIVDGYTINNVDTDVNILSLFMLNVSVDATFGGALVSGPEGKATLSNLPGNVEVSHANILLPANDIAQQLPLPISLTAQKIIDVTIEEFVMGEPLCQQLAGTIEWDQASVKALDKKVTLGKLMGQLSCDKGAVKFSIDPKNNLGLTFTAYIHSPERISGNGYIKPGKQFPAVLRDALPFIGNADKQGRYKLSF